MTVATYIAKTPLAARRALKQLRAAIKRAAPKVGEKISYGIPMFMLDDRYFLYIAAFKEHVSMYPVTEAMARYKREIAKYRHGRGTLRFSLDRPLPMAFVRKLAKARAAEMKTATSGRRKVNAAWHAKHPMPPKATLAQRAKWHVAHAKACGCRPMPASVKAFLKRAR